MNKHIKYFSIALVIIFFFNNNLQKKTETAFAPNSYHVNSKIFAGENVEPFSPVGPYIASTGTNLELIARDYTLIKSK